jgi:cytochrome c peroxidase
MNRPGRWWAHATALLAALAMTGAVSAEPPAVLDFTPDERARILRHGPWPPPPALDAGNALAGRPEAIALGQRLFFDARLSADGRLACASCHRPAQGFADGLPRGVGRSVLARNTPALWNAVHERWLGWDGAADSLWSQHLQPLRAASEMAASAAQVRARLAGDGDLACRWQQVFAGKVDADDAERVLVGTAKAIAAFVGTLVSARTPFDEFRDALARGDTIAAARYPLPAQRGLRLFIGTGQCSTCHVGPRFSHGEFGDIGVPFFVRPGVVDPGRHGGIAALRASAFNLLSRWSDDPAGEAALKTRHVQAEQRNFGEFKVPGLRNVALTAPYMHNGSLPTLDAVVRHYDQMDPDRVHADGEQILRPLRLNEGQRADLVAFLGTLSDPGAGTWRPAALAPCARPKAGPGKP